MKDSIFDFCHQCKKPIYFGDERVQVFTSAINGVPNNLHWFHFRNPNCFWDFHIQQFVKGGVK